MNVYTIVVGMLQTNCYLAVSGTDAVVIDPGAQGGKILKSIDNANLNVAYIMLTHGHFDHTRGLKEVRGALQVPILVHEKEADFMKLKAAERARYETGLKTPAFLELREGDEISFGTGRLKTLHTPGHTPGGACFLAAEENVCFTGDTLFNDGVGRTDFPGGDARALADSIRSKLMTLPGEIKIYPGHGPSSTIGRERKYF
ncbi:MAG: MBL fold metallo-hydrolase [bacterium]